jgi:benzoate-CoA ligase family protein
VVEGEKFEIALPERTNLGSYFLDGNLESGRGDKIAIYYRNRTYSFLDLWRLTNRIGNVLRQLGVEAENRVLLIFGDSPEWLATWLAVMKIGAVSASAYTFLRPGDYEHVLNLVRPKVVVVDQTTRESVRSGSARLRRQPVFLVAGDEVGELCDREFELNRLIESADDRLEVVNTHRDDVAYWNFSGGTTGYPKAVPHLHRDPVFSWESINHCVGYTAEDIVLRVPKLFFHYARDSGCFFALRSGAAVILLEQKTSAALIFEAIDRFRPTVLINVPTMMRSMIQTPEHERPDLSCLRYSVSSGELLSRELHEEWVKTFGSPVLDRMGSAETGMAYLTNRLGEAVPGSSGRVTPLVEVKLVDTDGVEVPKGQPGVMMVHGGACGRWYVRELEKTHATFPGNQWVVTGDVFVQDQRDYFWYVGRADEMVKVSGVWVAPLEVERTLQQCRIVKECVVLAVKDEDSLTKVKAFIVLQEGSNGSAEEARKEIKLFCNEKLAPHKHPRAVKFVSELPKTGQGKIDRRLLREQGF